MVSKVLFLKIRILAISILLFTYLKLPFLAQTSDCNLRLGTNISSIYDYATEICLVDLMKFSREWYTKGVGDTTWTFDTGMAQYLSFDNQGYPTHIPQVIFQHPLPQYVCTIWAITDGWKPGTYTLLWEGTGTFSYAGPITNWNQVNSHTITFDFLNPVGGMLQLCITSSQLGDPVRNIRLIMPGHTSTYQTQPFNPDWLEVVSKFKAIRFMDWGRTNNFGQVDPYTPALPGDTITWQERSHTDFYTYTHSKGVPYELMIKLMNDYDLDGWICVPHNASNHYIREMAKLFRDNLEPDRHLYVEFSNEIWNWIFGQTNWLYNTYNCDVGTNYWPECLNIPIENCMNIWTQEFSGQMHRITRVLGMFTGWFDVSKRLAQSVNNTLYDAIAPTYYFGMSHTTDSIMDVLGNTAGLPYFTSLLRTDRAMNEWVWIKNIVDSIAQPLNKKVCFYEGGHHVTPIPFGVPSTYDQILLDIQRDTAMYNLYVENYEYLKNIHFGTEPWLAMNFSLINPLSAQYGSWGLLESLYQDTSTIYAPKYSATLKYIEECNQLALSEYPYNPEMKVYPNPANHNLYVELQHIHLNVNEQATWVIYDLTGRNLLSGIMSQINPSIDIENLKPGLYILAMSGYQMKFLKN